MSGGKLVVLDRAGRDAKRYVLAEGLATLGSDLACNIRLMLPTVSPHHATVVVHAHQTVVHSVSEGETLVNGVPVSVAALHHEDIISLGGRHLRWEYSQPHLHRPLSTQTQPALVSGASTSRGRGRARGRGRSSDPIHADPIHHPHRASMPASTSMKQVAIVQPQRRDISQGGQPSRIPVVSIRRQVFDNTTEHSDTNTTQEMALRKSSRPNPKSPQASTTKASQWIESRKSRSSVTPIGSRAALTPPPARALPARSKSVALRPTLTPLPARSKSVALRPTLTPLPARSKSVALRPTLTPLPARSKSVALRPTLTPLPARSKSVALRPTLTPLPARSKSVALRPTLTPSRRRGSPPRRRTATPRRDTSLRSTVLRRTHSRPVKIEAPTSIDHTKQAAIMLMTRHTKSKSPNASVSLVVTRPSPVRTPKTSRSPKSTRKSSAGRRNTSVIDVTNSDVSVRSSSCPSTRKSIMKSALKDSKSIRKMESIKFDLSNLENENRPSDVVTIDTTVTTDQSFDSVSDISLRYSDSNDRSPSPRRSIHSRSSRIIEKTLGTPMAHVERSETTVTSSPRSRTSRGSIIVQKALSQSDILKTRYSKSMSASLNGGHATRTLSPRASDSESYSIVDLVLMDSDATQFNSVDSTPFGTPRSNSRKTRSTDATLLSSTPYKLPQKKTALSDSKISIRSSSMITPENSENSKPFLSTRVSKASRSRSRINDSDVLFLEEDDSPRTSKRTTKSSASPFVPKSLSVNITKMDASQNRDGTVTPENVPNNEEVDTPVLNIKSLLDSSRSSFASGKAKTRNTITNKRKTIGVMRSKRKRVSVRAKSLNVIPSRTGETEEGTVTPTGTVPLEHEGVKNKHSTAKKPQSKRSMIDDLNESDIVKQLFNSPVKRKLSRSMTEFSRHLFDDDAPKKLTRNTIAVAGRTPDDSFVDRTQAVTPEIFVSPLSTPSHSPNLEGVKRLFAKTTPENNLSDLRGVRRLLRSPQNRKSVKNDLTDVSGVKATFASSPQNRLSDVRVKELFQNSPKNDLRRVSGVKHIFKSAKKQKTPKNSLDDIRGVKNLFRRSPRNDLRNASGVKDALQIRSPNNDLTNVRGVRRMFRLEKEQFQSDVSGVKELFNDNNALDSTFDTLMGRPPIRTYTKAASSQKVSSKQKTRQTKSLHDSIELITTDVEQWLKQQKPVQVYSEHTLPIKKRSLVNKSATEKPRLPIKKRAVHSTPMKGHVTLNVSELGRVSPITAASKARSDVTAGTSQLKDSTLQEDTSKGTSKRRKVQNATLVSEVIDEVRPRATRSVLKTTTLNNTKDLTTSESTLEVHLKSSTTENNDGKLQGKPVTKRTRGNIAKQAVLQDTQIKDNKLETKDLQESQTSTRSTRRKVAEKPQQSNTATVNIATPVKSPRRTRGTKAKPSLVQARNKPTAAAQRRTSLVIHKKAPIVVATSVKKTRQRKAKEDAQSIEVKQNPETKEKRSTRQKAGAKSHLAVASPIQAARKTRGSKTKQSPVRPKTTKTLVILKKTPLQKAPVKKSRKKTDELDHLHEGLQESQTSTRSTRQKPAQKSLTPKVKGKAQKSIKKVSPKVETESKRARDAEVKEIEFAPKVKESVPRAKRLQKQPEKPTEAIPEKSQRGRKTVAVQPHDHTAAKRSKRNPVEEDVQKTNKIKEPKVASKAKGKARGQSVEVKRTRGKNAGATSPSVSGVETKKKTEDKPTKGKKQPAPAAAPARASRKRKSVDVTSSDKETSGAKRRKAAPAPVPAPAPAATRATRAKIAQESQQSTRARRR